MKKLLSVISIFLIFCFIVWAAPKRHGDISVEGDVDVGNVVIQQSGNVGIGTTNPTNLLQLSGGVLDMGNSNIVNLSTFETLKMADGSILFVDGTGIFYVSSDGLTTNDLTATGGAAVQDIFVKVDLGGVALAMADGATTVVTFSNEVENVGGNWDSTTHQFDVPVNGVYTIYFQGFWLGTLADNASYGMFIRTNNAQTIADITMGAAGTGPGSIPVGVEIRLTTDHFVEFAGFSGGTSDSLDGGSQFTFATIRLVRED